MKPISDPCYGISSGFWLVDVSSFVFPEIEEKLVRCIPARLVNAQQLVPCLIAVDELSVSEREQILDMLQAQLEGSHPYAVCAWLECEISIEELAENIGRFLSGPGPDRVEVFWRYFDPRVFSIIGRIFDDAQIAALLGPIKNWRFIWCRHWWQVSGSPHKSFPLLDPDAGWPSAEQWRSIVDSPVLSRVLARIAEEKQLAPEECQQVQKHAIGYLTEAVQVLRLNDEDDKTEFVYLCTKFGVAFREHPRLNVGWPLLESGEISWTELRLQLDATDYQRLAASSSSLKGISTWG